MTVTHWCIQGLAPVTQERASPPHLLAHWPLPDPDAPPHAALLGWERATIVTLAESRAEVDRSHRQLAYRGSQPEPVDVSESTVLRALLAEDVVLPEPPARERREKRPFPQCAELVPGVIWIYDVTQVRASERAAVAVIDMASRKWLARSAVVYVRHVMKGGLL